MNNGIILSRVSTIIVNGYRHRVASIRNMDALRLPAVCAQSLKGMSTPLTGQGRLFITALMVAH